MPSETSPISEPEEYVQPYVPGHAFVIIGRQPNGDLNRVCYHCGCEEPLAPRGCYANEEWTVIE